MLFLLWLILSGMTQIFLVVAGIIACGLCVYIGKFLNLNAKQRAKFSTLRITYYLTWLVKEIAKADWQIVKIILEEKINLQQHLVKIKTKQKYDMTKTIFANSITLTPGTITVETLEGKNETSEFIIHTLAKKTDNPQNNIDELLDMETKVCKLERP